MSGLAPADVVTLGEAMLRLTAPRGTRLADAQTFDVHVAGSEANVAAALAQLGVRTRWISRLPDSPLGRRVVGELAALGVLVDAVELDGAGRRLGLFFAEPGCGARATAVFYDRADSAFTAMRELPAAAAEGARVVHVSGITPALGPGPAQLTDALLHAAALVSVDVNYRARLWPPDAAAAGMGPLLARADVVFCAERDARTVFGIVGDADDVLDGVAALAPGARLVVLTRGARGCLARDGDGRRHEEPTRATAIVDRFGMGDALVAGTLWGVLRGDVALGLRAGTELAALKATLHGDMVRLEPGELDRVLAESRGGAEVLR
jgi:2-dehydro-3-deoxygluconokinase